MGWALTGSLAARALLLGTSLGIAAAAAAVEASGGYWSFRPPIRSDVPASGTAWDANLIDTLIQRALREQRLDPSPAASKERLLRRVCLDLTGLPPTPGQVAEFLSDSSPHAYERLVDSLLASPHYGERWAQKWLDVARFADTDGFERDGYRTHGWRYRDYVVRTFNAGKPYDRFVQEQVAGDELFPASAEALLATGFHGAGPRHVTAGNQDQQEARQEVLTEMSLGIGQVLLGLTVQCARCHDHKFDPISQEDYYRLESFFAATELKDRVIADGREVAAREEAIAEHEARIAPLQSRIEGIEEPFGAQVRERKRAALAPAFRAALEIPAGERTQEQARLAKEAESQIKPMWYEILPLMPPGTRQRRAALRQRLHALELHRPDPPAAAFAVANREAPTPSHVLQGGDYRRKGKAVTPGFLRAVGTLGMDVPAASSGRRAALALWLTAERNPLVARVMVNRIWEFRMGRGLMPDPNNFGLLGGMPTHPQLLDALALRFADEGWSVKAIDRLIVLSSAYRQSAEIDPRRAAIDPENRWYWRAHRRRLSGEAIRDSALAASGRLNRSLAGKPVRIPIEREVYDLIFTEAEPDNLWPVTPDRHQHDRRSLYLLNKRTVRLPLLANFDQPDTMTSCSVRPTSTHALQALSLLNSEFMHDQARSLAGRILRHCAGSDTDCQVRRAFEFTLARQPTPAERAMAGSFLRAGSHALQDFALVLMNRNEFVYRP
ncbi:MAG: DUF1549 and DUF1553 domain-containing protein [Bryobacterales bacterium]|nr:DUF1549 and DUF1553 domain-containing protein [Bryobacterales bacterium]